MNSMRPTGVLLAIVLSSTSLACPTKTVPGYTGTAGASGTANGGAGGGGGSGSADGAGLAGRGGASSGGASGSAGSSEVGGAAGRAAGGAAGGAGLGAGGMAGAAAGGAAGAGGTNSGGVKTTGSTCSANSECSSGTCRDSICCPAGCTLSCQGCASAVTAVANGTCAMRTSNPAGTQLCGNQCVNVAGSDASNCGTCGRTCAGGTCSAGECQALSLGTISSGSARNLVLSGANLYAITAAAGTAPSVWQLNPSTASIPISVASSVPSSDSPRCVMDGKLFWAAVNTQPNTPTHIQWCAVSNCAATTGTLVTSPGQQAESPVCDTTTGELVWIDVTYPFAGSVDSIVTIYRVAADGTNMRSLTSFYELDSSDYFLGIGFPNGRADRYFFTRQTFTPSNTTLFYVATNSTGVSPVQIATGMSGQNGLNPGRQAWANDTQYVWDDANGGARSHTMSRCPTEYRARYRSSIRGFSWMESWTADNFYGAFTTLPADAIGMCPLSNCTNPSILFRGQQNARAFTQDASAIYWATRSATGDGFTVWKGAK